MDLLSTLRTQAALASGWPSLHVWAADEASVVAALVAAEGAVGALPQADVIEPWDAEDDDPRWELRVDLPGLSWDAWAALEGALADVEDVEVALVPGVREAARAADDLGLRETELLVGGDLVAAMGLGEDGPVQLDLARATGADAALVALERELVEAVREVDPAVSFRSDRGDDTATAVIHRPTGRFGVQLAFGSELFEELDGDAVGARRSALLEAVGRVVEARAGHAMVRLAPDLLWDTTLGGLTLTAWFVAAPASGLPGDEDVPRGLWPAREALDLLVAGPETCEELELHVVPERPEDHVDVASAVAERLDGTAATGGSPRWVRVDGRWRFSPVWRIGAGDAGAWVAELAAEVAGLPGVAAVRVAPGEPAGLGDVWATTQPAWTWGPRLCLLRARDALSDRDRLPVAEARRRTPRDAEVEIQLFAALVASDAPAGVLPNAPGPCRAIVDPTGRAGLELGLDGRSFAEGPLRAALRAVGAIGHPDVSPVAHYAHRQDRTLVRVWFRHAGADVPPWRAP